MECVVDTNVLVFDTIEDSEFHELAAATLGKLDRWLVPTVVMEEYATVLGKLGLKRDFIRRKVSELLDPSRAEVVPVEETDLRSATEIISAERVSFRSFNDKLILAVARRRKALLLTFDKDLEGQCRRHGVASPIEREHQRAGNLQH